MALVYAAISRTTGGEYIGITTKSLGFRRRQHERAAAYYVSGKTYARERGCPALVRAMAKFGIEDFEWHALIEDISPFEAGEVERFCIAVLRPRYNLAAGGLNSGAPGKKVVCVNDGRVFDSIEHAAASLGLGRDVVSRMCRAGLYPTDTYRLAFKGERPKDHQEHLQHWGMNKRPVRWSADMLERLSKLAKARPNNYPTREMVDRASALRRRPVRCIETTTVFADAACAGLAHGIAMSTVRSLIYSGGKSRQAFVSFKYADVGVT